MPNETNSGAAVAYMVVVMFGFILGFGAATIFHAVTEKPEPKILVDEYNPGGAFAD